MKLCKLVQELVSRSDKVANLTTRKFACSGQLAANENAGAPSQAL